MSATGYCQNQDPTVKVLQPRSTSAVRSVAEKLSDLVSVKDFGARGDGTHDDSAAFQAAQDSAVYGQDILIPPGVYLLASNINITKDNVWFRGSGPGATHLVAGPSVTKLFNVDGGRRTQVVFPKFSEFSVSMNAAARTGTAFYFNNARQVRLRDLYVSDAYRAFWFDQTSGEVSDVRLHHFRIQNITDLSGACGMLIGGGGDEWNIGDGFIINGFHATANAGIDLNNAGGINMDQVDVASFGQGMVIQPPPGKYVRWVRMQGLQLDSNYGDGLLIDGTRAFASGGEAGVYSLSFENSWFSSNGIVPGAPAADGVQLVSVKSVRIIGSRVYANSGHGINVGSQAAKDVQIIGNDISGNSNNYQGHALNTYSGINVADNATNFMIALNKVKPLARFESTQKYGIQIGAGSRRYQVIDNDLSDNLTASYKDGSCSADAVIRDNLPVPDGQRNVCGVLSRPNTQRASMANRKISVAADERELPGLDADPSVPDKACGPKRRMWVDDSGTWLYVCTSANKVKRVALNSF